MSLTGWGAAGTKPWVDDIGYPRSRTVRWRPGPLFYDYHAPGLWDAQAYRAYMLGAVEFADIPACRVDPRSVTR